MSQYGMNGYNPMVYNQQPQNAYNFNNTPYVSGINWAQGIEGAKAFRIKPNDMRPTFIITQHDTSPFGYTEDICSIFYHRDL